MIGGFALAAAPAQYRFRLADALSRLIRDGLPKGD